MYVFKKITLSAIDGACVKTVINRIVDGQRCESVACSERVNRGLGCSCDGCGGGGCGGCGGGGGGSCGGGCCGCCRTRGRRGCESGVD